MLRMRNDRPHVFAHDCGFQAIAWMTYLVFQPPEEPGLVHTSVHGNAFGPKEAVAWRYMFEHRLRLHSLEALLVAPGSLRFGGVGQDIQVQLVKLLSDHGVPASLTQERAGQIIDRIGRVS